jgi:hypothetical protein
MLARPQLRRELANREGGPRHRTSAYRETSARALSGMCRRAARWTTATVAGRKAVMGALRLYLDFINPFLMLLRLFGDRRE